MAASKLKASEKADLCKKLTNLLKKRYKTAVPTTDLPVLETLLFAVCLEDTTWHDAEGTWQRLLDAFHEDLNEIRVSTITELQVALGEVSQPEWRALRIRSVLQHIFEEVYEYRYDDLKKKTLDAAQKKLNRIPNLTSFIKLFVVNRNLGGHVIPLDRVSLAVLAWTGLVDRDTSPEDASAALKAAVRKSDVLSFCFLLRSVATDPEFRPIFEDIFEAEAKELADYTYSDGINRLKKVLDGKWNLKPREKKVVEADAPAKKKTSRKKPKTTTAKSSAKKSPAKKTATTSTKATAKTAATKKTAAKQAPVKKATTKKSAAGKSSPAKSSTKKTTAKKSATKKTTKTAAKKSTTKKKTTAKKSTTKKTTKKSSKRASKKS